jgi:adenylosuccinate lyase
MLEFEAALATAEALAGVLPDDAAEACEAERFEAEALGRRYRGHRSRT